MCQKATGGFFGPYVTARAEDLVWTRGERQRFQSSNKVWRGFCGACGTPLTFEQVSGQIDVTIGSLDDPAPYGPQIQLGSPHKLPWADSLAALPDWAETHRAQVEAYQSDLVSYQHPDHETAAWPPKA
jgi:hypothetical protein